MGTPSDDKTPAMSDAEKAKLGHSLAERDAAAKQQAAGAKARADYEAKENARDKEINTHAYEGAGEIAAFGGIMGGMMVSGGGAGGAALTGGTAAASLAAGTTALAVTAVVAAEMVIVGPSAVKTSNAWNDAYDQQKSIKADKQDHSNLEVQLRQYETMMKRPELFSEVDKDGKQREMLKEITLNAQGHIDLSKADNIIQLANVMAAEGKTLLETIERSDTKRPFLMDGAAFKGARENREKTYSAEDRLSRLRASIVELADLTQKAMETPNPAGAKAAAKNVLSDKGIKGGQDVSHAPVPAAGGKQQQADKRI
jgi:hypothetical protein